MKLKQSILLLAASTGLIFSTQTIAADAAAGKAKAATCIACHGMAGVSMNPVWPNLAGQKDQYIIKQLKAFKAGTRKDPLMTPQAASLTDADMNNLAAYYSSL